MSEKEKAIALSQWNTPEWLAEKIAEWVGMPDNWWLCGCKEYNILEPSAGTGALVRALKKRNHRVVAIEVDVGCVPGLLHCADRVYTANFLEVEPPRVPEIWHAKGHMYDLVVMNPPYERGQDAQHIVHAFDFAPRVVVLARINLLAGVARRELLWDRYKIQRMAILSGRPRFDSPAADKSPHSDYAVFDIITDGGNIPTTIEWW